jgi:hypothetical protein
LPSGKTSSPAVCYAPRPDTIPEAEIGALAAIYRLVIDSANERGRPRDKSGPVDARERIKDARTQEKYTR